eukprot:COSAG01_NODE_37456_length_503_cov_0.928218_1_plen_34_part_10
MAMVGLAVVLNPFRSWQAFVHAFASLHAAFGPQM